MLHLENTEIVFYHFKELKSFNLDLSYMEVWSHDQNSKYLEAEGKIGIIIIINQSVMCKK